MADTFPELIGKVIHHCGALELLTNNAIRALGTDSLLSSEVAKSPFRKRIEILRRLLKDRTQLPPSEIKSLCDALCEIAVRRNAIAHNPIVSDDPQKPGTEHVMVVRYEAERAEIKDEIDSSELVSLVKRTNTTMQRFVRLIPSSTRT